MSEKVFAVVTDRMIKKLEEGVVPWHKPWDASQGLQRNGKTGRVYHGFNQFALSLMGYNSPEWFTFKQIDEMRHHVLPGEHGTPIVFSSRAYNIDENKEKVYYGKWFFRYYTVFNLQQTTLPYDPMAGETIPFPSYDVVIDSYKNRPAISNNTNRAYYDIVKDSVHMPPQSAFESVEFYYATLYHELTHSTGAPKRLNRFSADKYDPFGSEPYAFEELVADMGACYLCSHVGIQDENVFDNSASYIAGWLKKLKDDRQLVIKAGNAAAKAFGLILGNSADNNNEE